MESPNIQSPQPPPCPNTVTVRRNPPRRARPTPSITKNPNPPQDTIPNVSSFPLQEIMSINVCTELRPPPPPPDNDSARPPPLSENLKVFLRIRPLSSKLTDASADQSSKARIKNAWPQNPKKMNVRGKSLKSKSNEVCVSVSDSHSVILKPPSQDSKRIKSEVYEGFSHVFPSDSSQSQVYEKMVQPLVEDFIRGRSGMLAALGPSGSGKTHTVFGTPRNPGMVPLALIQIFKHTNELDTNVSRSFYMSIFEIYSEKSKMERVSDLLAEGGDVAIQQSTIKGLQEVAISDAGHAQSLVACAMLRRATGTTNTNSQSSRSQCIISIRGIVDKNDPDAEPLPNNAVLTIVDLAGAEREKRTGNQGSRLLESNFINNTSMVFSQCLRALLEHQKNPRKPLHKHFQNSLLTRYLRDYLEGKKRMTLLLTVKPGEGDYLDATYLLRQASPYMKIKFNNIEEPSDTAPYKRPAQMLTRAELPKRMRSCNLEAHVIEQGKTKNGDTLQKEETPRSYKLDAVPVGPPNLICNKFAAKEREHQILQNIAKATWNVLKQYKEKLRVAEMEIHVLNENLKNEKIRGINLEEELKQRKPYCTCSKGNSEVGMDKLDTGTVTSIERNKSINVDEVNGKHHSSSLNECQTDTSTRKGKCSAGSSPGSTKDQQIHPEIDVNFARLSIIQTNSILESSDHSPKCNREFSCSMKMRNHTTNYQECQSDSTNGGSECGPCSESRPDQDMSVSSPVSDVKASQSGISSESSRDSPTEKQYTSLVEVKIQSPKLDISESNRISSPVQTVLIQSQPPSQQEDAAFFQHSIPEINVGKENDVSGKQSNLKKLKRRLLPASSILLKEINALGIDDEPEKPKANRGGKKPAADERKRTQGSISLQRLLQSNLKL